MHDLVYFPTFLIIINYKYSYKYIRIFLIYLFVNKLQFSLTFVYTFLASLFLRRNIMSASNIPTKYGIILKYGFQYKSISAFIVS